MARRRHCLPQPIAPATTYNDRDQIVSAGTAQYRYDSRGNLVQISDGVNLTDYTYNAADRLTHINRTDGVSASYGYDTDGRRVQQQVGGQVTNYLWDEASAYGDVVLETNGAGAVQAGYMLGGQTSLAQQRDGTISYYLHDGQGNVRTLTNASGDATDRYRYDPFGELRDQQGTTTNPYRSFPPLYAQSEYTVGRLMRYREVCDAHDCTDETAG